MARLRGLVLRTPRLVMEPIHQKDSTDLYEAVVSQDSVMRWLATGKAGTQSEATAMCDDHVTHWIRHGYGDFAVRDAATREFLGRVGLRNRARYGVDLGFALHPRVQGRGIAGEAGRACLDLAFRQLALPAVFAFVLPDNAASIAALRRLGARPAGTILSSGRHCLRYRFDETTIATTQDPVVEDDGAGTRLVHSRRPLSRDDRAALGGGLADPFEVNDLNLIWADKERTLTAVQQGGPVETLGWLLREVAIDGSARRVAGLGGVLVHPDHRGRGIVRIMISVAVEHARSAGVETVILLCRPESVRFYADLGWTKVEAPVTLRQPAGSLPSPLTTMTYDLAGHSQPASHVDLQGLPF